MSPPCGTWPNGDSSTSTGSRRRKKKCSLSSTSRFLPPRSPPPPKLDRSPPLQPNKRQTKSHQPRKPLPQRFAELPSIRRAGMRSEIGGFEPFDCHMRVDLCGREARVSEERLHTAEIRAVIEQVRRKGVPQFVRR